MGGFHCVRSAVGGGVAELTGDQAGDQAGPLAVIRVASGNFLEM